MRKVFSAMYNMDKHKYLDPKFSKSLVPVMKFIQKRFGAVSNTSNISIIS